MAVEFRFKGGPFDGKVMRDDDYSDSQHLFVEKWWVLTLGGKIGQSLSLTTDKGLCEIIEKRAGADVAIHFYEVVENQAVDHDTVVSCEFRQSEKTA